MKKSWVVARTKHNREAYAAENILRQFAEPYLPKYAERVKVGGHFELKPKLLFPSYIFVRTLDGRWRFLLSTYGVSSVMLTGDQPAVVQDAEITRLRAYEDVNGLIRLPQFMPDKRFKRGDTIRVTEGPYSGYPGIYDGCGPKDRERILLDYLGRKTTVLIAPAHISAS